MSKGKSKDISKQFKNLETVVRRIERRVESNFYILEKLLFNKDSNTIIAQLEMVQELFKQMNKEYWRFGLETFDKINNLDRKLDYQKENEELIQQNIEKIIECESTMKKWMIVLTAITVLSTISNFICFEDLEH